MHHFFNRKSMMHFVDALVSLFGVQKWSLADFHQIWPAISKTTFLSKSYDKTAKEAIYGQE